MTTQHIETDYLIVGSGNMGLAFADTLLAETDAHITIVDRHAKPGGHWNDAYSFVALHQPSAYYGVNSLELGSGYKDVAGPNGGLYEQASGPEISGYFSRLMNQKLLPSGRVAYHPSSDYRGDNRFVSILSGEATEVKVCRKVVDATFYSPAVPSTHAPRFEIDEGVRVVAPNALPDLWKSRDANPPRRFVVIGGGKTGMDACIWLLANGAAPEAIQWVVPRDSWVINRLTVQSAPEFFHEVIGNRADQLEAAVNATSADDFFLRLEACRAMLRIDPQIVPSMFHYATLSIAEVDILRRIKNVVRLGRVLSVHPDAMQLEQGRVAVEPGTLFINCTASAFQPPQARPIFSGNMIVPQLVRAPLVAFSAATIAYVEAHGEDDGHQNRLCRPVPFPNSTQDYPAALLGNMMNQSLWNRDAAMREWMQGMRLDGFSRLILGADVQDAAKMAVIARLKRLAETAAANLTRLGQAAIAA